MSCTCETLQAILEQIEARQITQNNTISSLQQTIDSLQQTVNSQAQTIATQQQTIDSLQQAVDTQGNTLSELYSAVEQIVALLNKPIKFDIDITDAIKQALGFS